jgi:hypothetical protein
MIVLTGLTLLQFFIGLALIPAYAAEGAALSYAIWAFAAAVISTQLTHHWHMRDIPLSDAFAPALVGTIAMSAALWMVWGFGLAMKLAAGFAVYALAVWLVVRLLRQTQPVSGAA